MIGSQIGPYRVVSKIGEGGMGEVYRAHDTKLGRDVAIKILPAALAQDPDRRSRFEREARLLAALHHPHIATIFGVDDSTGVIALVMELVEGPTLQERIQGKGQRAQGNGVPIGEALAIARQIAEALDAAHERGIVHRDLKPANVKVTTDGRVKVLDFGLATAVASPGGEQTATQRVTEPGRIVGTAAYMSPEQARGQAVDKRTDIWAFGCVLFEMLTGNAAFAGETASDVMANILQKEPSWSALPAATPAPVKRLIARCLEKDQRRRLRDIGDVRVELDENAAPPVERASRAWAWWLAAAAIVVAAGAGTATRYWKSPPAVAPPPIVRFLVTPAEPISRNAEGVLDVSADGRRIAYIAGNNGFPALFVQDIGQFEGRLIPGTQGADHPAFSPDGSWVAFVADRKIKKVSVAGGEPIMLAESGVGLGLSWETDDAILFTSGNARGIMRVSPQGGAATEVTNVQDGDVGHLFPQLLPDGTSLLYSTTKTGGSTIDATYVQSMQTGRRKMLLRGQLVKYLSGHLLYSSNNLLFSVPYDPVREELTGSPVVAFQGVRRTPLGSNMIAFSRTGTVAYVPAEGQEEDSVVWVDRSGNEEAVGLAGRSYRQPRLSPDGKRLLVVITPANSAGNADDLWMFDVERKTLSRFTTDGASMPLWSPDGRRVAYNRGLAAAGITIRTLDGSSAEVPVVDGKSAVFPLSWSPDGRFLAYVAVDARTANDIWIVDTLDKRPPQPLLQTPYREGAPTFSPDGRFFAYASDASGRNEIYVRPFPGPGPEILVSTAGGGEPVWARHAPQLFYREGDTLMAVDIETSPAVRVGSPKRLFEKRLRRSSNVWPNFDVSPDGRHFMMIKGGLQREPTHLNVLLNWTPLR